MPCHTIPYRGTIIICALFNSSMTANDNIGFVTSAKNENPSTGNPDSRLRACATLQRQLLRTSRPIPALTTSSTNPERVGRVHCPPLLNYERRKRASVWHEGGVIQPRERSRFEPNLRKLLDDAHGRRKTCGVGNGYPLTDEPEFKICWPRMNWLKSVERLISVNIA